MTLVVCNEIPDVKFNHPQVKYIQVDFIPPEKVADPVVRGLTDKGRKLLKGIDFSKQFNPSHVMFVDADDCVSSHIAEYVHNRQNENGWYLKSGFKYREGENCVYLKSRNFYRMSGTANILRFDHLRLTDHPEYNRGYGYYKFYIDHQKVKRVMHERGSPLQPLPFSGAVYMLATGDNMSGNENNLAFNVFSRRKLTPEIQKQYCLYKIE
ncbi:MAG: hypothetical protein ACFB0C_05400 [Leptolyngbyaceae cyanobacterium]